MGESKVIPIRHTREIKTRPVTKAYEKGYERIFGKKDEEKIARDRKKEILGEEAGQKASQEGEG